MSFYGLDKDDIIENMYSALKGSKVDKEKHLEGYERISKIKDQVDKIRKELEKTKQKANT